MASKLGKMASVNNKSDHYDMIRFVVELTTVVLSNLIFETTRLTFTCSNSTPETVEKRREI